jgi:hypothetical protein
VLALIAVVGAVLFGVHHRAAATAARGYSVNADGTRAITPAMAGATLHFAPGTSPYDEQWVLAAIAGARPEARTLIDHVDGLVTITVEPLPGEIMGLAGDAGTGYKILLNRDQLDGERAIDRPTTVLHEFGHIVDFALVPPKLDDQLDAGIPRGTTCGDTGGPTGACAPEAERFADTFAKWALGGAVSAVGAGYEIAMPASIEDWGEPLDRLAAQIIAARPTS